MLTLVLALGFVETLALHRHYFTYRNDVYINFIVRINTRMRVPTNQRMYVAKIMLFYVTIWVQIGKVKKWRLLFSNLTFQIETLYILFIWRHNLPTEYFICDIANAFVLYFQQGHLTRNILRFPKNAISFSSLNFWINVFHFFLSKH